MTMLALRNTFAIDGNYSVGGQVEGWPCDGVTTQVFGQRSVTGSVHAGWDIGAPHGTHMYQPISGYVRPYNYGDFGQHLITELEPDDVYGKLYMLVAHMSYRAVTEPRWVEAGEYIGRVGDTGLSFGAHVHFAFGIDPLISGDYRRCVDPYIFVVRAQSDLEETMKDYQAGLFEVGLGDPKRMSASYDALNNFRSTKYPAGFFYEVNLSDGSVDPIDGDDTDLNDSVVRMKRLMHLAFEGDEKGRDAWNVIKG